MHCHASRALAPLAVAFALASAVQAQTIELLSRGVTGASANGPSGPATPASPWQPITDALATSADGRFIAYTSAATDLTPVDTNGAVRDVFVLDRATQTTELVSVWGAGLQGAGEALGAAISDDGRYVAFVSSTLLPADPDPFAPDLFVRDRVAGTTVELTPTETAFWDGFEITTPPQMSADGRYVAVVYTQQNPSWKTTYLRVWDRTTGALVFDVSGQDNNGSGDFFWLGGFYLARSGAWAAWSGGGYGQSGGTSWSASALVRSPVPFVPNGHVTLLQTADAVTSGISADGRYVAYNIAGASGESEMWLRDVQTGSDERIDMRLSGPPVAVPLSVCVGVSDDGRRVAFTSTSDRFVPGDTNGVADLFVRDVLTKRTWRASVDASGAQLSVPTRFAAAQADVTAFVFGSTASNLASGDTNGAADVFRRELWVLDSGSYCRPTTSANGCGGEIFAFGAPSAAQPAGYTIRVNAVDGQRSGLFFYGASYANTPFAPGHPSKMCVSAPRQRMDLANSGGSAGACNGSLSVDVLAWAAQHPGALLTPLTAGQSMCFQGWLREPSFTPATLLTDAWWVTLGP